VVNVPANCAFSLSAPPLRGVFSSAQTARIPEWK
jgi:hypothetical protein